MVSRGMWGPSPKRKSYHGTLSQDGHAHMAWKSAALQRQAGDNSQLPASSLAGSQAKAVKLGHCAVLTRAGDSNQYSKHYDP